MSTRCWIGQKREDGIHSFFCQCDGYPEYPGVGHNLLTNYNSEELATKLVDLCENYNLFFLDSTLEKTKIELDETDYPHPIYKTKKEYNDNRAFDIEYIYLWDKGWKIWYAGSFRFITPKMVEKKNK